MKFEFDFKSIIVLVIIVIVSTFSLGYTNLLTKDIIRENQLEKLNNQILDFFEDMNYFNVLSFDKDGNVSLEDLFNEGVYYEIFDSDEDVLGYVIPAKAMGYNDNIEVLVAVNADKTQIIDVGILNQLETPGIGTRIISEKSFLNQFEGLDLKSTNYNDIDGITGATVSSSAVISAVQKAVENIGEYS